MSIADLDRIGALVVAARAGGIVDLTRKADGALVRIRRAPARPGARFGMVSIAVGAPRRGRLLRLAPDGHLRLPAVGHAVAAGAIMGFIDIGGAILALRAPVAGRMARALPGGTTIAAGATAFEVAPD